MSFEVDFLLSQLVLLLLDLLLQLVVLQQQVRSLLGSLVPQATNRFVSLSHLLSKRVLGILQVSAKSFLPCDFGCKCVHLLRQLLALSIEFDLQLLDLDLVGVLLSVQSVLGFAQIPLQRIDLLLPQTHLVLEVRDHLLVLLNGVRQLALDHFHLVLVVVRLVPQLGLVLPDQIVGALRVPLLLVLEPLLESLLLRLVELSQLAQLLLGLSVDLLQLSLVQPFFLFELHFEFLELAVVSGSEVVYKPGFVRLKAFASLPQLVPFLLCMREVLPQDLVLLPEVSVSQLEFELQLLAVLGQLVDLLLLLSDLGVEAGLQVVALLLELLFQIVQLLGGLFLSDH